MSQAIETSLVYRPSLYMNLFYFEVFYFELNYFHFLVGFEATLPYVNLLILHGYKCTFHIDLSLSYNL